MAFKLQHRTSKAHARTRTSQDLRFVVVLFMNLIFLFTALTLCLILLFVTSNSLTHRFH